MAMRTFYIPGVSTPADLTNVSNVLRNVFDMNFITAQPIQEPLPFAHRKISWMRLPFSSNLDDSRPQVMLDVKIYQISHTFMRKIGVGIPYQFNLFNIPIAALAGLGGQNIQSLINQLISSGGINQANSQSIAGLLAQLQGQGNSIFSQPLATFGGGLTFEGLSLGTLTAQLHSTKAPQKTCSTLSPRLPGKRRHISPGNQGSNSEATFAPIFNTPAISAVLQNNTFQPPFPSFNYEDIGLVLKAKPLVDRNTEVNLQLSIQVRTIAGQSVNGVPIINNREYTGSITLKDGEPAFVAGAVSHDEQRLLSGLPGLGEIRGSIKSLPPVTSKWMTTNSW